MNAPSSNVILKVDTLQRYVTVLPHQTNNEGSEHVQHHQQQSYNKRGTHASPPQRQHNRQSQYHNNQNERQPSRQAQYSAKRPVEMSPVYPSQTQSLSASNVQENVQSKQYPYGRQHPVEHKNNNTMNKPNASRSKMKKNKVAARVKELTSEHLWALKAAFEKIVIEQFLSKTDLEQYICIYHNLRTTILAKRPDAQITLYGSLLLECFLTEANMIDIDIEFNETLPYETLKELLEIVRHSAYCKEAHIDIEHEPMCIDLTIVNANIVVRLTSNYIRAIQSSEIIRVYTKFDERVLSLLRLFRTFSKTCNIDKPDLGTLHPIVFHLMVIHFLQQLDPPVLPCLHEYVFGIDHVPVALNNNQYPDFFRVCNEYVGRWKSENTTSIEMLFLQLLSYYAHKFNMARFIVSIQTRMPHLKSEKQQFNRKLFCADPTTINRNLSYTMKASCSVNYFQRILEAALNYFCQRQNHENKNEMIDDNISVNQLIKGIDSSYTVFIDRFPKQIRNIVQEDVRHYYKQMFDKIHNPLPEPILIINENNKLQLLLENNDDEQIEDTSPNNIETISDMMDDDQSEELNDTIIDHETHDKEQEIKLEEIVTRNELQSIDKEVRDVPETHDNRSCSEEPVLFETLATHLNQNQKDILRKEYEQQVRIFNNTMQQILNNLKSLRTSPSNPMPIVEPVVNALRLESLMELIVPVPSIESNPPLLDTTSSNHPDFFFDMKPTNFGAEKGAPSVCTVCYKNNHIKSDCPELSLPNKVDFPVINREWIDLLSHLCRYITVQCKATKNDMKKREVILSDLQIKFQESYPTCSVHTYGSSHNGFGLRQSDIDVCVLLKDNNEQSNIVILENLFRTMVSNPDMYTHVELVRDARVPIIRSTHCQSNIQIDISLHNVLAMENTRLLKTYSGIDSRVSELGYMIKHLVKTCDIGDASCGTLSSYAYIIMLIHFLQQIQPAVLPVLQQLRDDSSEKTTMIRECNHWNVYFYDNLSKLKQVWKNNNRLNTVPSGILWIEFLRFYTEIFDYGKNVVTIRQCEPLQRWEKGWFHQTIAIEDPFILTHNLADKLSLKNWTLIRRVFIRAGQHFCTQPKGIDYRYIQMNPTEKYLFHINTLCPENVAKTYKLKKNTGVNNKQSQKSGPIVNRKENEQVEPLMQIRIDRNDPNQLRTITRLAHQ